MNLRKILIITLILSLGLIYGCSNSGEIFPTAIPLENSIKEIITSKGKNYDFIGDELFNSKVDVFAKDLLGDTSKNHYVLGNLDEDNIPELVVFIERNHDDINDQGGLGVYKFTGEKYELLDKIGMNYDNSNYLLKIGKISPNQNGILLSNEVGAHSTMTYGYILQDGKLKSILNEKKISLISVYSSNEIRDIDGDGVLEFSIYTIDPETEEQSSVGSDKLMLWYKWDGKDGGNLIKVEKEPAIKEKELQNKKVVPDEIELDDPNFISTLKENIEMYTKDQSSQIIANYLDTLKINSLDRSNRVEELFQKYQKNYDFDYLSNKYGLSIERLNDIEYLKREKVLQSEVELKEYLIKNIEQGYKLSLTKETYFYLVDYQKFINIFGDFVTNQFKDYLKIKSLNGNEPYMKDESLSITQDLLAERIVELERFKLTYPYSPHLTEVNEIYRSEILAFLYGGSNTPTYNPDTKVFDVEIKEVFKNIIDKYPHTYFSDIVQALLDNLEASLNILSDDVRDNVDKFLEQKTDS